MGYLVFWPWCKLITPVDMVTERGSSLLLIRDLKSIYSWFQIFIWSYSRQKHQGEYHLEYYVQAALTLQTWFKMVPIPEALFFLGGWFPSRWVWSWVSAIWCWPCWRWEVDTSGSFDCRKNGCGKLLIVNGLIDTGSGSRERHRNYFCVHRCRRCCLTSFRQDWSFPRFSFWRHV